MFTAIMAPITTHAPPSELSRAAATYYTQSSSSLPPSSLPSWSLDHSCTTFKLGRAATAKASHPLSSKLIDDDPNQDEEDHIRGNKRNRRAMFSSATPTPTPIPSSTTSKIRYYPTMLFPGQGVTPAILVATTQRPGSRSSDLKDENYCHDCDHDGSNTNGDSDCDCEEDRLPTCGSE